MVSNFLGGSAYRDHFRVRGWIIIGERAVVRARNDLPFVYKHSADGNLAALGGQTRFVQRGAHEFQIRHGGRITGRGLWTEAVESRSVKVWFGGAHQIFHNNNIAALLKRRIVSNVAANFAPSAHLTQAETVSIFGKHTAN